MNDPLIRPVTVTEIADLLARLPALSAPQRDTAARALYLAAKADLLARIADQHARDWTCDQAKHARQAAAADARVVAERAQAIIEPAASTRRTTHD